MLVGRGMDLLDRLSSKLPLLGVGPTVPGITRAAQQRQAQSIGGALVKKAERDKALMAGGQPSARRGAERCGAELS